MSWTRDWTVGNRIALCLFSLCAAGAVAAAVGLIRLAPVPKTAVASVAIDSLSPRHLPLVDEAAIVEAVARNPMRRDRRRANGRFGQHPPAVLEQPAPPPPVPDFRVAGIARRPSGPDLAAIGVGRQPARIVRRGEMVEGFELRAVRYDSVVLVRSDTVIRLPVPGTSFVRGME